MRAVVFETPGIENLKIMGMPKPKPGPGEVLVRVKYAGVNPVDYFTINNKNVRPIPHIPGAEFSGVIEEVGPGVGGVNVGDEVVIYNRLFDGTCRYCLMGHEELCVNSGLIGVVTQGGFAEYAVVPTTNALKVPKGVSLDEAATLPVGALTAWHMLNRAEVHPGEVVAVFGATGNVGSYAIQFAKLRGAIVVAVSRRADRVRQALMELGADYVVTPDEVKQVINELSEGLGADVVVDAVGQSTWNLSFSIVAKYGRWITAGALTGGDVTLNLPSLYSREVLVIGSTGGTRAELRVLLNLLSKRRIRAPIYTKLDLERVKDAFDIMFKNENRVGKVLLTP
ncbi:MAG: alcohol dehydrogenase [Vulcanisaeta sp. CIS_19]|jgi:Zn-dependent alcohol dehydrogenases|nr:MAG: alcohol dehydrogenase [Vulcanisaeta sp. CIS_19]